ncbi:MAG: hypothetical protein IKM34_00660 [Clostridia bacterium]|nr:hypothetical protein [Clostridia bacterium]
MNSLKRFLAVIFLVLLVVSMNSCYVGDVWQDTPEKALSHSGTEDPTYSIKTMLKTIEIDDIVDMTFVNEADTLTSVSFVTNDKGQYCVSGSSEEVILSDPDMFVVNGDPEQFILFPYSTYHNTVYGWCYENVFPAVNGITPTMEAYTFECQAEIWTLKFWWIDGIDNADDAEVSFDLK